MINPLGSDPASFWNGLMVGRQSGVRAVQCFDTRRCPTRIAGEIADFDAKKYLDKKDRKSLRVMARTIQLAVAAAQLALDDCQGRQGQARPDALRRRVRRRPDRHRARGTGRRPSQVSANCQPGTRRPRRRGASRACPCIPPLWMLKYLPNMLACHVSILHNAQGPNNTITESDVASLLALGEAYRILRRDQADFFLVGGADSKINPLSMVRQCLFGHLSQRNDAPGQGLPAVRPQPRRPGPRRRRAASWSLEELEHAQQARRADLRRGGRLRRRLRPRAHRHGPGPRHPRAP